MFDVETSIPSWSQSCQGLFAYGLVEMLVQPADSRRGTGLTGEDKEVVYVSSHQTRKARERGNVRVCEPKSEAVGLP